MDNPPRPSMDHSPQQPMGYQVPGMDPRMYSAHSQTPQRTHPAQHPPMYPHPARQAMPHQPPHAVVKLVVPKHVKDKGFADHAWMKKADALDPNGFPLPKQINEIFSTPVCLTTRDHPTFENCVLKYCCGSYHRPTNARCPLCLGTIRVVKPARDVGRFLVQFKCKLNPGEAQYDDVVDRFKICDEYKYP